MRLVKRERGDTLIEVLFAVAIFAMVAVGSLSIMNQGTATAQRSLEITLVREQIDAQAEAIRFIHSVYVANFQKDTIATGVAAQWVKMTSKAADGYGVDNPSQFGVVNGTCPAFKSSQRPFILNTHKAIIWNSTPAMTPSIGVSTPPFAQVIYSGDVIQASYGIWIEAVPSIQESGQPGFVDFHIRACWDAAGSSVPATIGTIVRLYEPR